MNLARDAADGRRAWWIFAGGMIIVALAARAVLWLRVPLPPCGFKWLTGHPCPLCGGTRSLAAWAEGDLLTSWLTNPLVATAWTLGLVYIIARTNPRCDRGLARMAAATGRSPLARSALIALILAHWAYLILAPWQRD